MKVTGTGNFAGGIPYAISVDPDHQGRCSTIFNDVPKLSSLVVGNQQVTSVK